MYSDGCFSGVMLGWVGDNPYRGVIGCGGVFMYGELMVGWDIRLELV